ncbi:hypothetical protein Ciccas_011759 [Cichlidogyrus casuarinus]|uniref:Tyrosinase copper-binding domain-containing protein n=1 Tax=Cichlidogyrus casuarinus TaxID=1844966 RepID=A0ABD2PQA7_9PLAT
MNGNCIQCVCIDSDIPCGGPLQGICSFITPNVDELDAMVLESEFLLDDRLGWPTRFFNQICICQGNFAGPDCSVCKFGWSGPRCSVKRPAKMRRNVLTLSAEEQREFRDRVALSKRTASPWLLMNITNRDNADPINSTKLNLVPTPSIYDFFVYIHLYSARSTLINIGPNDSCDPNRHKLDFAHKGPGFTTWHRYFVMSFEQELARLGTMNSTDPIARRDGDNFALPYWDWTGAVGCPICQNDLVGAMNASRPVNQSVQSGNIDSESPFAEWSTFCPQRPGDLDCHICDPSVNWRDNPESPVAGGPLWRNISDPAIEPNFSQLPSQEAVDSCLRAVDYDVWPYRQNAGRLSFRDMLEGFTDPLAAMDQTSTPAPTTTTTVPLQSTTLDLVTVTNATSNATTTVNPVQIVFMHNLVHSYINGSWFDVATSPNDPLFWLHHSFVDKLFELWMRKQKPTPQQYPKRGCPAGKLLSPRIFA